MRNQLVKPAGADDLSTKRTRFLLYCHDTFGLGHLRRTIALAEHFTTTLPDAEVLIVTGSPMAHAFKMPPRVDYIKLPAVTKEHDGTYRSRDLSMDFTSIRDMRAMLLYEAAYAYRPDVFIVDHAPQGWKGEALHTLAMLKAMQPQCLRVLGLRDIIDASHIVRKNWAQENIYQTLEYDYDLVLVYGSQQFFDLGKEYGVSDDVIERLRYCGYLNRVQPVPSSSQTNAAAPHDPCQGDRQGAPLQYDHCGRLEGEKLVVVTAGGGGDGFPLMQTYLAGLQQLQQPGRWQASFHQPELPYRSVLLTGPFLPEHELQALRQTAATLRAGSVEILPFLADPLPLLNSADLVVAMAGYNSTCELIELGQRTLLVPRTVPRQEQLLRASLLAQHGLVSMLHPNDLQPDAILSAIDRALAQPRPSTSQREALGISFQGQQIALEAILDGLDTLQQRERLDQRVVAQVG